MRRTVGWLVAALLAWAPPSGAGEEDPLLRGRDLLGGPEHERGVAILRGLIEELGTQDGDAVRLVRLGRAHLYLGEGRQAIAAFERAGGLAPKDATPRFWLGLAWRSTDPAKAAEALESAVALDPEDGDAWYELGRVREDRGEPSLALTAFLKAAERLPDDAVVRYRAGVALTSAERPDEAVPHFERALALDAGFVNAAFNLGLLHYLAGRYERARDVWTAAAEHAPMDLRLHAKALQALHALGDHEEAARWREKVLRIHERSEDEETRSAKEFVFDQFLVGDRRVFACERFPGEPKLIEYPYVFRVTREGKETLQVNLETNAVARELGTTWYVLGADEGEEHRTYDRTWDRLPPYPELKRAVVAVLRGEIPVVTRSTRRGGRVDVEVAPGR